MIALLWLAFMTLAIPPIFYVALIRDTYGFRDFVEEPSDYGYTFRGVLQALGYTLLALFFTALFPFIFWLGGY